MKRKVCLILAAMILFSAIGSVAAADDRTETAVKNGCSYAITIKQEEISFDEHTRLLTVKKTKEYEYYDSGTTLWKVKLTGYFQYNGVSATCIGSDCTTTVYASGWSCSSKSSSETGNAAIADATMVKKVLGVVTETRYVHLTLTCDPNGNVS